MANKNRLAKLEKAHKPKLNEPPCEDEIYVVALQRAKAVLRGETLPALSNSETEETEQVKAVRRRIEDRIAKQRTVCNDNQNTAKKN